MQGNSRQYSSAGGGSVRSWAAWSLVLVLIAASVAINLGHLDLMIEGWFWSPTEGWRWANHPLVKWLYEYGTWPALIAGGGCALLWVLSRATGRWVRTRPVALFLALLLLVGPGLVINFGLKEHTGRSRPRQVTEFGGDQPYRAVGEFGPRERGRSFPSGHASMGFYWLGLSVFFWERHRTAAWCFGALGLIHGLLMGLARMAQGGHWPSDVLWSAGCIWLCAWGLNWLLSRRWVQDFEPGVETLSSARRT